MTGVMRMALMRGNYNAPESRRRRDSRGRYMEGGYGAHGAYDNYMTYDEYQPPYAAPESRRKMGFARYAMDEREMNDNDIRFANEKERRYKLVAHVEKLENGKIIMSVMPQLISRDKYIYSVEDEFNGVVIKGKFYDKQFMFGRGAGGHPTGSAVLSDIMACFYNYRYEYKRMFGHAPVEYTDDVLVRVYLRYSNAEDRALFEFATIEEQYISNDYKYLVGHISLANLHKISATIRERDLFIAAYPTK